MPPPDDAGQLVADLTAAIADLDGYIMRRAHELAAAMVEQAQAEAEERIRGAGFQVQRLEDVNRELRRRVAALSNYAPRMDDVARRLEDAAAELRPQLSALEGANRRLRDAGAGMAGHLERCGLRDEGDRAAYQAWVADSTGLLR